MGDLVFDDVCAWVGSEEGRQILKGVSGRAAAGELTMLMGASGAGKSTLLATLAGRARGDGLATLGSIEVGGEVYDGRAHGRMGAFVEQDTAFHPDLTPREILTFRATLALASVDRGERVKRVNGALAEMRLQSVASTRIGELGAHGALTLAQRKRLAVAAGLLVQPAVLLVDEPTTGLDARAAERVVIALADVARDRSIAILATIHQPPARVLAAFDAVVLMADGRVAYRGCTDGLSQHMARVGHPCPPDANPADHVLAVLDGRAEGAVKRVGAVVARAPAWDGSAERRKTGVRRVSGVGGDGGRRRAWVGERLLQLVWRSCRMTWRNEAAVKVNVIQAAAIGLLLGLLFNVPTTQAGAANRAGLAFLSLTNVIFISVQATTVLTILERAVVLSEMADGLYTPVEYVVSKVVNEVPFQTLYLGLYTSILYPMTGLRSDFSAFAVFFAAHVLTGLIGTGLGLAISTTTDDVIVANALAPVFIMPAMMFSGFLVSVATVPSWIRWLRHLSPLRSSFILALRTEAHGLSFTCKPSEALDDGSCPIPTGHALVAAYDSDAWADSTHWLLLVAMYIALVLVAVAILFLGVRRRLR